MNIKILPFALLVLITSLLIVSCSTTSRFQPESFADGNKFKKKTSKSTDFPIETIDKSLIESDAEQQGSIKSVEELDLNQSTQNTNLDSITNCENPEKLLNDGADAPIKPQDKKSVKEKEIKKNTSQDPQTPPKKNSSASLGFWFSIAGLIGTVLPFVGLSLSPILYILGLIFSIRGLTQINRSKEYQEGKSLAIAGIVISSIMLLLTIIVLVFLILIMLEMLVI